MQEMPVTSIISEEDIALESEQYQNDKNGQVKEQEQMGMVGRMQMRSKNKKTNDVYNYELEICEHALNSPPDTKVYGNANEQAEVQQY